MQIAASPSFSFTRAQVADESPVGRIAFLAGFVVVKRFQPRRDRADNPRMALHPCPECAAQISSLAATCPSCGCPVSAEKTPATGKPKKSKPIGHVGTVPGCLVILLTFGIAAVVSSRSSSPDHRPQQRQDEPRRTESPGLLRVRRQDATKHVLRGVLRDPDSATFTFEERGPNTLRVRVRSENAFGGHVVQSFDITFPPGSVVASQVQEVD